MRVIPEQRAYKEAGKSPLDGDEKLTIAEAWIERHARWLAHKMIAGESFQKSLRHEFRDAEMRKALNEWKRKTGAQWDGNRRAFVIVSDDTKP